MAIFEIEAIFFIWEELMIAFFFTLISMDCENFLVYRV
jgi:hypothetical protein